MRPKPHLYGAPDMHIRYYGKLGKSGNYAVLNIDISQ